jgi:hypothetical protein
MVKQPIREMSVFPFAKAYGPGLHGRSTRDGTMRLTPGFDDPLQSLMSAHRDIPWQRDSITFMSENGEYDSVRYTELHEGVSHYLPFGAGPKPLFIRTIGMILSGYKMYEGDAPMKTLYPVVLVLVALTAGCLAFLLYALPWLFGL